MSRLWAVKVTPGDGPAYYAKRSAEFIFVTNDNGYAEDEVRTLHEMKNRGMSFIKSAEVVEVEIKEVKK